MNGVKPNIPLQAGDIVYIPKDAVSGYNVFVRKVMPTAQLINMLLSPISFWYNNNDDE